MQLQFEKKNCCRFRVLILLELMKMNRKAVRIFIYLPVLAQSRTRVGLAEYGMVWYGNFI